MVLYPLWIRGHHFVRTINNGSGFIKALGELADLSCSSYEIETCTVEQNLSIHARRVRLRTRYGKLTAYPRHCTAHELLWVERNRRRVLTAPV